MMTLNDGSRYKPNQTDVDKWTGLYPAVDVVQELNAMAGWLDANPKKRKTSRGIKRFINAWLARAQDSGGSPMAKSKQQGRTRDLAVSDELVDISWLPADQKPAMREYFMKKYGRVYEG